MQEDATVPVVRLEPVPLSEKPAFSRHFQDYLRELSSLNGARPDRDGRYRYDWFDLYWEEPGRMPFFLASDGQRAGLMLLRELPGEESPIGAVVLQVAELYVFPANRRRGIGKQAMRLATRMAEERRLPLTWSAYMNNGPANILYCSVLEEFAANDGRWQTEQLRGIDRSGLARFYYQMTPRPAPRPDAP